MILDAITSSPLNVFVTIVIGIGLAYLYYRKPSSSSSSSSSTSRSSSGYTTNRDTQTSTLRVPAGGAIDEELQRAIAAIERQERDTIRQEQDAAYQQSLQADRQKKLKREEELRNKEAQERAEKERLAQLEELHRKLTALKGNISSKIPTEFSQEEEGSIRLLFKLPDGTRVKRNFHKNDKVKYLFWFVFSLSNAPLQFKMTTNFPKRDLPGRPPRPEDFSGNPLEEEVTSDEPNSEKTLEEANLTETQIILVHDIEA